MKSIQLWTILTILIVTSCNEYEDLFPGENGDVNKWIYEAMQDVYYWETEMPDIKSLNRTASPETFFYTLLSAKDGKIYENEYGQQVRYYYSYIKEKDVDTKAYQGNGLSFGFEFQTYYDENLTFGCKILYVLPNSPASEAELKRGQWVTAVNGKRITKDLSAELRTLSTAELTIAETIDGDNAKTIVLDARNIVDNPIFISKIIEYNGKKVAYIVYNHFTSGPNGDNDKTYDNQLKRAIANLATEKPDEFVLDLRYNNGGLVSSANVLASLLVPEAHKQGLFYRMDYNENLNKKYDKSEDYFDSSLSGIHYLDRLYIITGTRTASASELVIAGLQPYMNLFIFGEKTEGKNVGSTTYRSGNYNWQLQPIICNVVNKTGTDYSAGIDPTYECKEPRGYWGQLGDEDEHLLSQVLNHITNGIAPVKAVMSKSGNSGELKEVYSSLDRRKTNGIVFKEADLL